MVLIFAGNKSQADHWVKELGLDRNRAKYISEAHQVLGLNEPHVICCGTYWERDDYSEIKTNLEVRRASFQVIRDSRSR